MTEIETKKECYARIRELIKEHQSLSGLMTKEALRWLDNIVPDEIQTYEKPNWELDI